MPHFGGEAQDFYNARESSGAIAESGQVPSSTPGGAIVKSNGSSVPRKPKSSSRILLVDDHEGLARIRQSFLIQEGYDVLWARDGSQARFLLATEVLHLVITDSALGELSGWEVAAEANRRGLPVILSSGRPVRLSAAQLAARGVDFLCPKPCRLQQLLSLVKKALRQSRPREGGGTLVPKTQYQSHG
jgi:DNA-binding response OmpR family regulator